MNLNQITIKSKDVNQAVKFYIKLGLKLIVDSTPRYARLECPVGGSTFSISHAEAVKNHSLVIYFEVENLDHSYKKLSSQGVVFTSQPQDQKWLWREVTLLDPDDHQLKLFTAGNNRRNPPWRVKDKRWFEYLSDSPVNLMK